VASGDFQVHCLATVRLSVVDVPQSRDWYSNFFGVSPVDDLDDFASFNVAGATFDIVLADEKSPASTGGTVGYWLVNDLDKAIERAVKFGGKIYRGPLRVPEIQRTIVQIVDPNGNVFGLEANF
jgi:predicted enzyme related to lactoylglutathione lyase